MTAFGTLLAAGLLVLAVAGVVDLVAGARWVWPRPVPYLLGAAGAACVTVAGAGALAGRPVRLAAGGWPGRGGWLGPGTAALASDRLSGLFLAVALGAAVPVSLAFASWASRPGSVSRRGLAAGYAATLGAVTVIITATDVFTFLLAWETLTIAFSLLAGHDRQRPGRPGGAMVTLVSGRVSGVVLLAGWLLLAVRSGSLDLASFAHVPGGAVRVTAQALLIAGFAIKVGLVPFQVWLPRAYAAAPGPARAIMAGVAVNAGFYGLWRTLSLLGAPPAWLTTLLLVLAGLTALLGIGHAAVQPGLHRVIAYSSVENGGLIVVGYGVALTGAALHDTRLTAAGLLAATLQIITNTAAKSLMFTASAVIAPGQTRTAGRRPAAGDGDDLDLLRGSARRLPWSGTGLAVGSLTLAGLPLTAGFASEWFLLEALLQQFRVPGLGYRLVLAVAGAAVALTAGFAGVTFVRLTGLVVLGPPPGGPDGARPSRDYGWLGRAATLILAAGCLVPAALLPLVIRAVAAGLSPVVPGTVTAGALKSPWVVQPVFGSFSILSPSWLWVVMPLLAATVLVFMWLVSGARMTRVRRVPAWRSATAGVEGADCYTATGFASPTRRVLATVLHTRSQLRPLPQRSPGPGSGPGPRLGYSSDVIEVVETYLYRPLLRPVMVLARAAQRLQSGRLDAYLAYMLIALAALLALVTALA